jgi:hypothetical protein
MKKKCKYNFLGFCILYNININQDEPECYECSQRLK